MRKEKLTLNAIKQDLMKMVNFQLYNKTDWRLSYIVPVTLLAILVGVLLGSVLIGLLIFSVSAYHIVRYVIECKEYRQGRHAIVAMVERGEISISTEVLSHIAQETIYEPHTVGKRTDSTKTVTVYYFNGGSSWRVPTVDKHYAWSKEFYISSKGLENISVAGNEFLFVSLQAHPEITYIYPCKNFEPDASLKSNAH